MRKLEIKNKKTPDKHTGSNTLSALDAFGVFDAYDEVFNRPDYQPIVFTLKTGKQLSINAIHFSRTYSGLIGYPTKRINEHCLQEWSYPEKWGRRKELVIQPTQEELDFVLKASYCSVWLHNNEPVKNGDDSESSELVVTFGTNLLNTHSIVDLLTIELADLDWENNAENFAY